MIRVTFQLGLVSICLGLMLVQAKPSLVPNETETTSEAYCPWPPCYEDSWNVDFAQIPIYVDTTQGLTLLLS